MLTCLICGPVKGKTQFNDNLNVWLTKGNLHFESILKLINKLEFPI